jgi:hypothetical protein
LTRHNRHRGKRAGINRAATKPRVTHDRDVASIACYRSLRGAQIAAKIDAAAAGDVTHARALAVADKVRHCSRCENAWHGEDVQSTDGELYEAAGTLYACDERLCPACLAKRSRNARKKAREGITRAGRRTNEIPYFVTLTIPTLIASQCGLLRSLLLLLHTWRLFTKRKFFADHFRAGVKGSEFTLGDQKRLEREGREWMADVDGWHPHIHFVSLGCWIKAQELRAVWTECYLSACASFDIVPVINTKDGLLNCHLRYVTQGAQQSKRNTISLEGAIIEACKYITKNDSWLKIPESELLAIANIKRWPRMFELIGCARNGCKCGVCAPNFKRAKRESSATGAKPYFNTTDLSAADSSPPEGEKWSRSLRETGRRMIERGQRAEWLILLGEYVKKAQGFRRRQLAGMYPFAIFRTLDGKKWGDPRDFNEQIAVERKKWAEVEGKADLAAIRLQLAWQERERWEAYIEHGAEALTGDERAQDRMRWTFRNVEAYYSPEETENQKARAFALELSGRMKG